MEEPCVNCGAKLRGKFCHKCGEKKVSRKDFALSTFLAEVFSKFTHLDSKVFRTLWWLVRSPGYLTVEYLRGRRKPYMKPLALFFVINLLYFISIGFNQMRTYETPLKIQFINPYGNFAKELYEQRMGAASEAEKTVFEARFNAQNHLLAKAMLLLMVPMLAVVLWLLYLPRGLYFGEHLVTALHFHTLLIVLNMVLGILLKSSLFGILFGYIPALHSVYETWEPIAWVMLLAFITLRQVYPASFFTTLWKSALTALAWLPLLIGYRLCIFLATFYSID